jgi:AcrR family transcriptional regulator
MPKLTYENLSTDKKDRIFNAGVLEFSYNEKHVASVNRIVRMANISKGSFYQYFENKDEFYWFIVMTIIYGKIGKYQEILKKHKGDLFKTEEELFNLLLDLLDDSKYRNIISNVYKTSYMELKTRLSAKGSTIYIDMYDTLMSFGFKGYDIKSKEDFLIVFDMLRNITNHIIMTMIGEHLSKVQTKELYQAHMSYLEKGIVKRGLFS